MDSIKDIVNQVIKNISTKQPEEQQQIQNTWEKILNEKELRHTQISGLKEETLIIHVDSSAWLYQFRLKKKKILRELQVNIKGITNIHFKIGKTK